MIHAHFVNMTYLVTYEEELNILFKSNNLPTMKVPKNPPSAEIIAILQESEEFEAYEEAVEEMEEPTTYREETEPKTQEEVTREEKRTQEPEVSEETRKHTGIRRKRKIKGLDMGLTIYSSQSTGFPTEPISDQHLSKGIQERKYKYTYRDDNVNDEDILRMIEGNTIDLTQCFAIEEDSVFKRIRSGLTEERSPPPTQKQKR